MVQEGRSGVVHTVTDVAVVLDSPCTSRVDAYELAALRVNAFQVHRYFAHYVAAVPTFASPRLDDLSEQYRDAEAAFAAAAGCQEIVSRYRAFLLGCLELAREVVSPRWPR